MLGRHMPKSPGPPSQAPLSLTQCLAKSCNTAQNTVLPGRLVFSHCQIVGGVARALMLRMPLWLRVALFPDGSELIAAAHDVGKVSPTFQNRIYTALSQKDEAALSAVQMVNPDTEKLWGGHAGVSQATAEGQNVGLYIPQILGQHHGFSPNLAIYQASSEVFGGQAWQAQRAELLAQLKQALGAEFPVVRDALQARVLAGLTTVADWIGSGALFEGTNEDWQPKIEQALDVAGFIQPQLKPGLSFSDVFVFTPKDTQKRKGSSLCLTLYSLLANHNYMSRPLRIEYSGAWYHVMNRGRRGEDVFADKEDHEAFLAVLREAAGLFGIEVAAYCLMSNHYHLLVHTPDGNISRAMRHINGVYTQRYNRRRGIDGQLFRGRYKCVLVEADSHLLELLRYIHRNPIRAGMCKSVDDFVWSSHAGYISRARKWDWLSKDFLLAMISDRPSTAIKKYREFVQGLETSEVLEFYGKKNLPSIFGTDNFVQWVKDEFFERKSHQEIPQSRQLAPTIADIKEAVCRRYGITEKDLAKTRRGQVNEPRNLAIYLSRKLTRSKLEDIGKEFALGNYSSVSSAVIRTESLLANSDRLRVTLAGISENLNKSQAKT